MHVENILFVVCKTSWFYFACLPFFPLNLIVGASYALIVWLLVFFMQCDALDYFNILNW